jgi:precorrin-6B methylase 2
MPHTREHLLGLTTRPGRYQRLTRRPFRGIHTRLLTDVVAANLPRGARILDVGTGPGTIPIDLATAVPQVTIDGVDLSAQMIGHGRAAIRKLPARPQWRELVAGDRRRSRRPLIQLDAGGPRGGRCGDLVRH